MKSSARGPGERGSIRRGWQIGPEWLRAYRKGDLGADVVAGVTVATMLVPQAMAYALLADLPVEVGLYASLLPVAVYALSGTSRFLSVGPVAMISLLVANAIGPLAGGDSSLAIELAVLLALMVGVLQLAMGVLRAGFLVNFLSHPVLSGFTTAAAVVIGSSQLKHFMDVDVARTERPYQLFVELGSQLRDLNLVTLAVGVGAVVLLLGIPRLAGRRAKGVGVDGGTAPFWSKSGPLAVVIVGSLVAWFAGSSAGIPTVGETPQGLPALRLPVVNATHLAALLPTAVVISLVGFMESFAVAQALASKRRQRVDADRELVALGVANLSAACSGAYPVTGGFSRSVVNFDAGARTGLASLVTAAFMAGTLLFLTPLLVFIPNAVLAAIILVALLTLIDFRELGHIWSYSRADGACWLITFAGVLAISIEVGVLIGALASILFFLWRTSRPHVATVGRVGESEHFRNIERHEVELTERVLAIRVDESLYFANVRGLEERLLTTVSTNPSIRHLLLICSGINFIDATGLRGLESCLSCLRDADVSLSLAEVKGPVSDRLAKSGFIERIGQEHVFLSTHEAMESLRQAESQRATATSLRPVS